MVFKRSSMALLTLAAVAPIAATAQGSPSQAAPTATPPSSMGRWDGYRDRQEQMRRQDDGRADRRDVYRLVPQQHIMNDFAGCVLRAMPDEVEEAVLDTSNNRQFNEQYGDPMREACGSPGRSALVLHNAYPVRAALAAAAIRTRYAGSGPTDFSTIPSLWHQPALVSDGPGPHREQRAFTVRVSESNRFLSVYGECIARAAPEKVRLLLLTESASVAEQTGFHALQPELAACLNNGATMRLGTNLIRQSLAYNYYRLAVAASAQPTED